MSKLDRIIFEPLNVKEGKNVSVPEISEGIKISFSVVDGFALDKEDQKTVEAIMEELLANGYSYVFQVVGGNIPVSRNLHIELTPQNRFRHQGVLMKVPTERMLELIGKPDSKKKELEQSQVIHELIHNLDDAEAFPMFIEMIYMLDRGQKWRIEEIQTLYKKDDKLGSAYQKGLEQISEWLGYSGIEDLLSQIVVRPVAELKEIFKAKLIAYCENDEVLSKQMKK